MKSIFLPVFIIRILMALLAILLSFSVQSMQGQTKESGPGPYDEGSGNTEIFYNHVNRFTISLGVGIPTGSFSNADALANGRSGAMPGFYRSIMYSHMWPSRLRYTDYREKRRNGIETRAERTWRTFNGIHFRISSGNFAQSEEWGKSLIKNTNPSFEYRLSYTGYSYTALAVGYSWMYMRPKRFFLDFDWSLGANLINTGDIGLKQYQNGSLIRDYNLAEDQTDISFVSIIGTGINYRLSRQIALRFHAEYLVSSIPSTGKYNWYTDDGTSSVYSNLSSESSALESVNLGVGVVILLSRPQ